MQVLIFGRKAKEQDIPYIEHTIRFLQQNGISVFVYKPLLDSLKGQIAFQDDIKPFSKHGEFRTHRIDTLISLGGDGTILEAVCLIRDTQIPILGINLGRLGFLASIEKSKIQQALTALISGTLVYEDRVLLALESSRPMFDGNTFALNDMTILKRDTSSMITIHTYINGDFLTTYWADGLIVSTPTGSTGYSLSCGGPIIFPNSNNFVITPVAPHNLNIRPLVIPDSSVISFEVEGRADNFLCTLDSRFETITAIDEMAVRKNNFTVRLAHLEAVNHMETIRKKLTWGTDMRN